MNFMRKIEVMLHVQHVFKVSLQFLCCTNKKSPINVRNGIRKVPKHLSYNCRLYKDINTLKGDLVMDKNISYEGKQVNIGIDVHKKTYVIAVLSEGVKIHRGTHAAIPEE